MANQRGNNRKNAAADRRRIPKKKVSILTAESITYVDYKDVNLLRRFMSERAKIRARRVTGNSTQQQREVAKAIRVAREMALLPYSVRQVTQRSKGGGRGRDRDRDLPREERTGSEPTEQVEQIEQVEVTDTIEVIESAEGTVVVETETIEVVEEDRS